mgnify:CR=1 FL=1
MKIYNYPSQSAEKKVTEIANRSLSFRKKDYQAVASILEDVRRNGDAAVINFSSIAAIVGRSGPAGDSAVENQREDRCQNQSEPGQKDGPRHVPLGISSLLGSQGHLFDGQVEPDREGHGPGHALDSEG